MHKAGFTLIELVMVILLLAVLAAVAIPNFIDFRSDSKNAATQGGLGALRSAVAVATAAIALREDPTIPTPKYPTGLEMQANAFSASHPVLSGTAIMDPANGVPKNPWSLSTLPAPCFNTILVVPGLAVAGTCGVNPACIAATCQTMATRQLYVSHGCSAGCGLSGWVYLETTGEIWANSSLNGKFTCGTGNLRRNGPYRRLFLKFGPS